MLICVTLSGIVMEVSLPKNENAQSSILVVPSGITYSVSSLESQFCVILYSELIIRPYW